ncbi:MFS general substrate transporter [Artomyces pyxidatus]|uniref:MFS general substrate transporter n=1 Tax=Artomyces pyxidatus TaxID=48021 RepID=A0ACB8TJU0_9AGAM|nr:MFS general substrate transporter [Artomyces pyxidatus]
MNHLDPSRDTHWEDERRETMTKRVLWKLDFHVLPAFALMWLTNFMDRTNIGNARIAGLQIDLHLRGNEFNIGLAAFFTIYILVEIPSNWVLKKVGPSRWLPFLVIIWGIVATLTGLIESFGGLVAVRLVLGASEGGLLPGIILYMSTIYKPHEFQQRVGIFYATSSLSGAFGGLLASAILKMDGLGNLAGWRWIFILEGIATCMVGLLSAAILPRSLETARFLTEEERIFVVNCLRFVDANRPVAIAPAQESSLTSKDDAEKATDEASQPSMPSVVPDDGYERFEWIEVIRGLTEIQAWLIGFAYFGILVCLYSLSLFL